VKSEEGGRGGRVSSVLTARNNLLLAWSSAVIKTLFLLHPLHRRSTSQNQRHTHLVGDVGLLVVAQQGDAAVCLGREDVDERVAVAVERHRRRRFEQLAVQRAQNADVVVGARG